MKQYAVPQGEITTGVVGEQTRSYEMLFTSPNPVSLGYPQCFEWQSMGLAKKALAKKALAKGVTRNSRLKTHGKTSPICLRLAPNGAMINALMLLLLMISEPYVD